MKSFFSGTRGLGFGLGLRVPHYSYILENRPAVDWFEIITENYLPTAGGPATKPVSTLEKIRENYPIVCHGVSLSIGSTDPLDRHYLKTAKTFFERLEPEWVSDHLCWTGVEGENLHDLLPLPYTEEALAHLVDRIRQVQDFWGRRILIENVSSYVEFKHSVMPEWEFLSAVAKQADCGILLDVNNVYVSHRNHGFDPKVFLDNIPVDRVGQFHLAGHTDHGDHVIDTHDHPVRDEVWELFRHAVGRFGEVSVLLERDDKIPPFPELFEEVKKAEQYAKESYITGAPTLDALGDHRSPRRDRGPARPESRP